MADNHTELCERLRTEIEAFKKAGINPGELVPALARIEELEKERDALKADAGRWRIIESTLPTDELQDIAIIVAAEHSVNVANGLVKDPSDLLDAAVRALQAEKEARS